MESFVDRSLSNLNIETIDLLQMHCPPTEVYSSDHTFEMLDYLVSKGKIQHYGFNKQKGSAVMKKLLESAIANAENNNNSDIDKLSVKSVIVNQGMRLKRMKARARGRADRIIKPTCHIEIILVEETN